MTRAPLIAAALALALAGSALVALAHGDPARESPADVIATCTACHDATFVVMSATAPASGTRAGR